MNKTLHFAWILLFLYACGNDDNAVDAYGNFEAVEVMVSAEANGKLIQFDIEEGDQLAQDELVAIVDTTQLYLKKAQLQANIGAIKNKTQDIKSQIDVLKEQKANITRELNRVKALIKDEAATSKQLDDLQGELDVVNKQIKATRTQLQTGNTGLLSEIDPLKVQIEQIEDQIDKSKVQNPVKGTVLGKYAEEGEVTSFGKPLYKIANLEKILLRAYVSETQLAQIKLGQEVTVQIDNGDDIQSAKGTITWIAGKAEFTPKEIQTRDERVNLVYAIKVLVPNDGTFKIGMPGEVVW